jgi:hypothetical protein
MKWNSRKLKINGELRVKRCFYAAYENCCAPAQMSTYV